MMRWMECGPCDTMWRGDEADCHICGHAGLAGVGPKMCGSATYTVALVEAVA